MDFLNTFTKHDEPNSKTGKHKPSSNQATNPDHNDKPSSHQSTNLDHKVSTSELMHSAKVVADAANAHFRHEPQKYDKQKLAGATADLLNAASEYGKLDDNKGVGKYVDKAEDYLRKYGHNSNPAAPGQHKTGHEGEKKSGGGSGDFMKMAGDFLKK